MTRGKAVPQAAVVHHAAGQGPRGAEGDHGQRLPRDRIEDYVAGPARRAAAENILDCEGRLPDLPDPVKRRGEYKIEVVEASENIAFNIRAMGITVVGIVPGCIGVIYIEDEAAL